MVTSFGALRQGWRLECGDTCVLRHGGQIVECVLVDLSISGILVQCDEQICSMIQEGDECGVLLCSDPQHGSGEITGRVVRKDGGRIGLHFPNGD